MSIKNQKVDAMAAVVRGHLRQFNIVDSGVAQAIAVDVDNLIDAIVSQHITMADITSRILGGMYANVDYTHNPQFENYDSMSQMALHQAKSMVRTLDEKMEISFSEVEH